MNLTRNSLQLIALISILAACGDDDRRGSDSGPPDRPDTGFADAEEPPLPDAGMFAWPVPTAPINITSHESWKNRVTLDDPFRSAPAEEQQTPSARWIKFVVLMRDPSKVYFQNSTTYPQHFEFATERLDPFLGLDRMAFDALSLHEMGQDAILGAILIAPRREVAEYGVQFIRAEPYHPEMVRILFDLVKQSVDGPNARAYYFPTYEQVDSARNFQTYFQQNGIEISSVDRWLENDGCYSTGWALGRLVQVPVAQIAEAHASGALKAADILFTDGIPDEIPYLAGVITTVPGTPSALPAMLAQSYRSPFAFVASAEKRAAITALVGREVLYRTNPGNLRCNVSVLDISGEVTMELRTELAALRQLQPVMITPKVPFGSITASTDDLGLDNVQHFGGKAAYFGMLRAAIPTNSPVSVAFSFDLFDAFMGQMVTPGKTLRQEISEKLALHRPVTDVRALKTDLAMIRDTIVNATAIDGELAAGIDTALAMFDPMKKIRFRASTNVEDGSNFTGEGLYDSFSGCLADDTDQDAVGPSACDPADAEEKGVYRALRKVFASFYNDIAVLERVRRQIPEDQVGMAVLVHHSFPDETELANGKGTFFRSIGMVTEAIEMTTQLGAVPVTSTSRDAIPEQVSVYRDPMSNVPTLTNTSSLVPPGGHVMEWETDYVWLSDLLGGVANQYAADSGEAAFQLDFEYKKLDTGELVVKQVRPLPITDDTPSVITVLIDEPSRWCVLQGDNSDVFAIHRTKSIWSLSAKSQRLTSANLAGSSLYRTIDLDYVSSMGPTNRTGDPTTFPGFIHEVQALGPTDLFGFPSDAYLRFWYISTGIPSLVIPSAIPVVTLRDARPAIGTTYQQPVPWLGFDGRPAMRMGDTASLVNACPDTATVTAANPRVEQTITAGAVTVQTSYYHPQPPPGEGAGYTASLYKWDETTITGLTTEPIVLRTYWSQTYRPARGNMGADYIFEPQLEANISSTILDELEAANIRYIVASNKGPATIYVSSLDGRMLRQIQ